MSSWSTSTIHADGVALAVHRRGRGEPVVGLTAIAHDVHDFDAFAERVGDRFEVIVIEWPGHGRSGPDREPASAARYASLLTAALDEMALPAPILIGNSVGGAASILHASRRPVRGVVLCDSGGLVEVTPFVARVLGLYRRFFAAGERGAAWYGAAFALYYRRVLTEPAAAAQRRRIVAGARQRARILREAFDSFGRPSADIRHVAASLDVPVWAAWGEKDMVAPLRFCRPALERLKRGSITTFKVGHTAFLEAPDAFAAGFLEFAGRLPKAPPHGLAA